MEPNTQNQKTNLNTQTVQTQIQINDAATHTKALKANVAHEHSGNTCIFTYTLPLDTVLTAGLTVSASGSFRMPDVPTTWGSEQNPQFYAEQYIAANGNSEKAFTSVIAKIAEMQAAKDAEKAQSQAQAEAWQPYDARFRAATTPEEVQAIYAEMQQNGVTKPANEHYAGYSQIQYLINFLQQKISKQKKEADEAQKAADAAKLSWVQQLQTNLALPQTQAAEIARFAKKFSIPEEWLEKAEISSLPYVRLNAKVPVTIGGDTRMLRISNRTYDDVHYGDDEGAATFTDISMRIAKALAKIFHSATIATVCDYNNRTAYLNVEIDGDTIQVATANIEDNEDA